MPNTTDRRGRGYRSRLNKAEQDALDVLARSHGYEDVLADGLTIRAGVGFVLNILSGEVATVLLGDEERAHAIGLLLASDDETLRSIGDQLLAAARREEAADQDEAQEYIEERRQAANERSEGV